MKREEYRKFQWLASVCIAVFILSFAVCLLAFNRSVYRLSSTDYRNGVTVEISKAEAELYYGQIADSYCRFFTGKYRIAGYELSDENVHQLNRLKGCNYRLTEKIICWIRLWRRRETMPCFYGSAGGACLVALLMLRIVTSKREVYAGLRNMIFRGDYGYFSSGDVLCKILPETFARNLALLYLGIVAAEIFVFVMIRVCVRLAGRSHRF